MLLLPFFVLPQSNKDAIERYREREIGTSRRRSFTGNRQLYCVLEGFLSDRSL